MRVHSENGECREFLVVPPEGERFDRASTLLPVKEALERTFPGYKFIVSIEGPQRFHDWFVVPVLGEVGGDEGRPMLKGPSLATIQEIATCLAAFNSEAKSRLN